MLRKILMSILLSFSLAAIVYGGFFREFRVYDNIEKFDKLKDAGIKLKLPGMEQGK